MLFSVFLDFNLPLPEQAHQFKNRDAGNAFMSILNSHSDTSTNVSSLGYDMRNQSALQSFFHPQSYMIGVPPVKPCLMATGVYKADQEYLVKRCEMNQDESCYHQIDLEPHVTIIQPIADHEYNPEVPQINSAEVKLEVNNSLFLQQNTMAMTTENGDIESLWHIKQEENHSKDNHEPQESALNDSLLLQLLLQDEKTISQVDVIRNENVTINRDSNYCSNENTNNNNTNVGELNRKPLFTFTELLLMAIEASPMNHCTYDDVYQFLQQEYPYFCQLLDTDWKSDVRHTLSQNKCFIKLPNYCESPNNVQHYWTINKSSPQFQVIQSSGKLKARGAATVASESFKLDRHSSHHKAISTAREFLFQNQKQEQKFPNTENTTKLSAVEKQTVLGNFSWYAPPSPGAQPDQTNDPLTMDELHSDNFAATALILPYHDSRIAISTHTSALMSDYEASVGTISSSGDSVVRYHLRDPESSHIASMLLNSNPNSLADTTTRFATAPMSSNYTRTNETMPPSSEAGIDAVRFVLHDCKSANFNNASNNNRDPESSHIESMVLNSHSKSLADTTTRFVTAPMSSNYTRTNQTMPPSREAGVGAVRFVLHDSKSANFDNASDNICSNYGDYGHLTLPTYNVVGPHLGLQQVPLQYEYDDAGTTTNQRLQSTSSDGNITTFELPGTEKLYCF